MGVATGQTTGGHPFLIVPLPPTPVPQHLIFL